jgi:hypothetical protein
MADVDPRPPGAAFDAYFCPDCEFGLADANGESHLLHCARCGKYFEIPVEGRVDAFQEADHEPIHDDELSAVRIRQLAAARRAAYRSRSYCVIAAIVCVVAAVQLAWTGIALLRAAGFGVRAATYFPVAAVAVWGAGFFFKKAVLLDREAKQSALPPPTAEPDFTPLSDGSQQWKNLEDVR